MPTLALNPTGRLFHWILAVSPAEKMVLFCCNGLKLSISCTADLFISVSYWQKPVSEKTKHRKIDKRFFIWTLMYLMQRLFDFVGR